MYRGYQKAVNIGIVGVGGVGGYFGGKLANAYPKLSNLSVNTYFVVRGKHLEEIKQHGLILNTDDTKGIRCYPTLATDDISEIPDIDIWLLCVKSYDLEYAMKMIEQKVNSSTLIIPLLNGVDIYDKIRNFFTECIILPSSVYIGAYIEKPGTVTQKGGTCKILFGRDPQKKDLTPYDLFTIFGKSSIQYEWLEIFD